MYFVAKRNVAHMEDSRQDAKALVHFVAREAYVPHGLLHHGELGDVTVWRLSVHVEIARARQFPSGHASKTDRQDSRRGCSKPIKPAQVTS